MAETNPLQRAFRRLGASSAEIASEELRRAAQVAGTTPISELKDRQAATLRGRIMMLTITPRSGTPWLEAEFSDGSGSVQLIWMGRREIPGITPGRELLLSGRVSCVDGHTRIYNPRYELIAD